MTERFSFWSQKHHPVLLASDHPANPGHGNHPGYSTYQELMHLARVGVPLDQILKAATLNNATTFGLANDYGTIEAGKIANLLLLRANPLQTIDAYDQIESVVLQGKVIARHTLAAPQ